MRGFVRHRRPSDDRPYLARASRSGRPPGAIGPATAARLRARLHARTPASRDDRGPQAIAPYRAAAIVAANARDRRRSAICQPIMCLAAPTERTKMDYARWRRLGIDTELGPQ